MSAQTAIEGNTVRKIEPVPEIMQTPLAEVVQFPKPKLVEPVPAKPAQKSSPKPPEEVVAKTAATKGRSKKPQSSPVRVVVKTPEELAIEAILPVILDGRWGDANENNKPTFSKPWFLVNAHAKGLKIDIGWRKNGKKDSHTFSRMGKREFENLKEQNHERQCWILFDRFVGELESDERDDHRQVAARLRVKTVND